MDDKLKIYELLYKAYANEIKNLWQRSVFLGTFMVLVWTGYGALQLNFIEKCAGNAPFSYHLVSLGLCAVIIVLSLLWVAMAKGSKFVQEAHEDKIDKFDFMNRDINNIFCNLDDYEPQKHKSSQSLFLSGSLKAYRYSPSKINIALGIFSIMVAGILYVIHIMFIFCEYYKQLNLTCPLIVIIGIVLLLAVVFGAPCLTTIHLKGEKSDKQNIKNTIKQQGEKMTILFFCQHCGASFRYNINNVTDEYKLRLFAKEKCELNNNETHILSAVVLPDEKK